MGIYRCQMMFCKEKNYPTIAMDALAGFIEDKEAAKRYSYRFLPWSLSCVAALLCFGACIFIPVYRGQYDPVAQVYMLMAGVSFALCLGLFVAAWRRMVAEVPVSPRSGKPMEVYRLADTIEGGKYELVYVCRESHTYFRAVYREPGD